MLFFFYSTLSLARHIFNDLLFKHTDIFYAFFNESLILYRKKIMFLRSIFVHLAFQCISGLFFQTIEFPKFFSIYPLEIYLPTKIIKILTKIYLNFLNDLGLIYIDSFFFHLKKANKFFYIFSEIFKENCLFSLK